MFRLFLLISFLSALCLCNRQTCAYKTKDGWIDLSPLNHRDLVFTKPFEQDTVYFRPCGPTSYTCGTYKNAAVCEKDNNGNHHSLGIYTSASWKYDEGIDGITIVYKDGDVGCGGVVRSSTVMCLCNKKEVGKIDNLYEPLLQPCTYELLIESKYCCISRTGVWFKVSVLVMISMLVLYLGGGYLFLTIVKKEKGLAAIPNIEFWQSIGADISRLWSSIASKTFRRQQYTQV
ncbi:hypothetical protein RCL1_000979 [Eukaryota sp. TZLM3-RCL]